ncbi:MAG: RES family NAD+ phosphorylase [Jatrophihabitantaceae bacterium]
MVKLPLPPEPGELQFPPEHDRVLDTAEVLWRMHRTSGEHVVPWNRLRYWGPAATMRFDPHEPRPREQDRGASYAALSVPTALAEVFQRTRVINIRRGTPYLTAWSPARPLTLLDLTGSWPIQAGASHAINAGRRDHCRAWARAIHSARPDLDGLWHHPSTTGGDAVTLFTHAADSFPDRPVLSLPLNHPGLRGHLLAAAAQINYRIV